MAKLKPNTTYVANGVTVNEKIIPDGTRWKSASKAKKAGFAAGSLYKSQAKLKVKKVTIHNTNDLGGVHDDGEQYTRATYPNENMNSSRVHFYVDDVCAWQNLKAGTGMSKNDPIGSAEVGWHAGDGSSSSGGNMTSLSIESIMNDNAEHDAKAKDNTARLAAFLLKVHGLDIDDLVTHTYWVNKSAGKTFKDVDEQCCNRVSGKKWCPAYIFASTNEATALRNWKAFKELVKSYLNDGDVKMEPDQAPVVKPDPAPVTKPVVESDKISVTYQVWDDVKNDWLPNVKDREDYAGIYGHDICAIYANLSKGDITYRVHTKGGKWLPAVKNRNDYAGIFNKPIDGLMMKTNTDKKIYYRVHLRKDNKWLPFVTGYSTINHNNGYAGVIGKEIDAIEIYLA